MSYSFEIDLPFHSFSSLILGAPHFEMYSRFEVTKKTKPDEVGDQLQFSILNSSSLQDLEEVWTQIYEANEIVKSFELDDYTNSSGKNFTILTAENETKRNSFLTYLGAIEFQGKFVFCSSLDFDDGEEIDPDLIYSILDSYEEYSTDRENEMEF